MFKFLGIVLIVVALAVAVVPISRIANRRGA